MLARVLDADPTSVTRRRVLLGASGFPLVLAASTVSACTDDPPVAPPPDPDRQALESAHVIEGDLRATILAWTAESALQPTAPGSKELQVTALAVVDGHLSALDAALGSSASASTDPPEGSSSAPSTSAADLPVSTATLVASLDAVVDEHTEALRSASPAISPLLASVAASDAALGAAVRRSAR
jgi:hypothetical protein